MERNTKSLIFLVVLIIRNSAVNTGISVNDQCLKITSNNFILSQENIAVDLSPLISNWFQLNTKSVDEPTFTTQLQISEKFLEKFKNVFVDSDIYKEFSNDQARKGFEKLSIFNSGLGGTPPTSERISTFLSFSLWTKQISENNTISSGPQLAKRLARVTTSDTIYPVKAVLLNASSWLESPKEILATVKDMKTQVGSLGLITAKADKTNFCIFSENPGVDYPEEKLDIVKLLDFLFVRPTDCSGDKLNANDCFQQIVDCVESCHSILGSMIQPGKEKTPRIGVLTTSTAFGKDYASRAQLWCLLSDYGRRTNRTIIMRDDDDFIRDYVKDSLIFSTQSSSRIGKQINSPDMKDDKASLTTLEEASLSSGKIIIIVLTSVFAILVFIIAGVLYHRKQKMRTEARSRL